MSDECGGKYQRWYQLERQLPSTNAKQEEQEHILYHKEKDNDLPTYEETAVKPEEVYQDYASTVRKEDERIKEEEEIKYRCPQAWAYQQDIKPEIAVKFATAIKEADDCEGVKKKDTKEDIKVTKIKQTKVQ